MSDWKYDVDDLGEEADSERGPEIIEPGEPRLENILFVLLGIVSSVLVVVRVTQVF